MNWLKNLILGPLKKRLAKEMKAFTWSAREREEILKHPGFTTDDIIRSEQVIRIAGSSWIDRQVK